MNLITCSESCRWQQDGMCTLDDITRITGSTRCCYFEELKQ